MTDHADPTEAPADEHADVEIAPAPSPEELGVELPDDPAEAIDLLLRAVLEARSEGAELRDGHLRALAEADNIRKRSIRDRAMLIEQATERTMHKLLPVLDSFRAGLEVEATTEVEEKLHNGMSGVFTQLMDALASEGLVPIEAEGEPFDPTLHEAVSVLGEGGELTVHHQIRPGYRLGERVLRPASVVVGPAPEGDGA
ncbi:MAG: nucleotide exchange factor GrpE [Acidimicrobiia bacterium]|nr:nucleotide exchange factor GrpE [Acidimicrobiia bacterium]